MVTDGSLWEIMKRMDEARRKTDGSKTINGKQMDPFSGKTKKRMDQAEKVENRWIQNGSM
jgi:hypothetical protein